MSNRSALATKVLGWLVRGLLALVLLAVAALLSTWLFLRGSLARLDGTVRVGGLKGAVSVTRDALGAVTVSGMDRRDVAYATGYVHAQERFFQMDLLRRLPAGELAALLGPAALPSDRERRLHRFRARAGLALQQLSASDREVLGRYTAGVNDGLAALTTKPFEYALLRSSPQPWQAADSLLTVWAMYLDLQGKQMLRELARGWLAQHSTREQLEFLLPTSSQWDAPLDADAIREPLPPIPPAAPPWFGVRASTRPRGPTLSSSRLELRTSVGSNNWAVSGARTASGSAIVANDMHLMIRLPHIWFRGVLSYTPHGGATRRIAGVMLPGVPAVVVGSNGRVAWGFTNSYGDYVDLIEVEPDPGNPQRVRTSDGWEDVKDQPETIEVRGQPAERVVVRETKLGPIWHVNGHDYIVRWVAHDTAAVNMEYLRMEVADDVTAALAVGRRVGIPAQNLVVGDSHGRIGWTLAGLLPERESQPTPTFPLAASASNQTWRALRAESDYPSVIDPPGGQLWTANSRQLAGPGAGSLGDGGADLGARAQQIRDALRGLGRTSPIGERDVYAVSLDDRALFIAPWRERALRALDAAALAGSPERAEFRRLLESGWDGHASVQSVGYRLARSFVYAVYDELFAHADEELQRLSPRIDFDQASSRWQVMVARLLDEQPPGWLPPGRKDWREVQLAAVDATIRKLTQGGKALAAATWGEHNTVRIAHPFAAKVPLLQRWLAAPADAMPGDENMPRVAAPIGGQSQRMAVTPGREDEGILNMPGGQSGHPLSPYFLAGHDAWVRGEPTPLLPGPAQHTLEFLPR
jgi:penicillin amidase